MNLSYRMVYKGTTYLRYGYIVVGSSFLEKRPELLFEAFSKIKFLPTKVVHDIIEQKLTYYGLSPHFDFIKVGEKAPQYEIFISPASFLGSKETIVKVVKKGE